MIHVMPTCMQVSVLYFAGRSFFGGGSQHGFGPIETCLTIIVRPWGREGGDFAVFDRFGTFFNVIESVGWPTLLSL